MRFQVGDLVVTKLHVGSRRDRCRVVGFRPTGKVQVRGRSGRLMQLLPHQLCLVSRR